jgi:NAD(P)-dependent dehydrogenase (short-subunit alcohol dehydrogenase family)
MKDFSGKLAVITGGGTGMGRELARALVAEGCDVAMCDVSAPNMTETKALCEKNAPQGVRILTHEADVSDETQVIAFRNAVAREFDTDNINLLFNNAGIAGAGSFVTDERDEWERTFNICWNGVYLCARAFMPMLVASSEGHIINTSSVNGFWASIGPQTPHTAYSASKFAVKGFTEALVTDLRINAPHVKASVVMPGHIGTQIVQNSAAVHGRTGVLDNVGTRMSEDEQADFEARADAFENNAPMSAAEAAQVILNGVREERWRILVGEDAKRLDEAVRKAPEEAYEESFFGILIPGVGDEDAS